MTRPRAHGEHVEHGAAPALAWWARLLAVVFIAFGIGLPLIGARVFSGADLLLNKPPWNASQPSSFSAHNPCVGDTVDGVEPQQQEFRQRALNGDFASWDPYVAGGSPLGSLPTLAAFSPLSLPFLLLPGWYALGIEKLLEMLVSIGGTYLLLRRLKLGKAAATIAGVVYTSSGFLVTWTNWPHPRVAAFVPALFWAIERFVQRRAWRDVALIGLVVACMLFGGFPAVVGYALYLGAPYLLWRLWTTHRGNLPHVAGGAVVAGVGLALGVAITAVQLVPFALHLAGIDLGYRHQQPGSHLPYVDLVTTWVPNAFGLCVHGEFFGPAGNPIEGVSFVGATASVLALVGLTRRPHPGVPRGARGFLTVALAVVILLGWFGGPLLGLAQHFPVFSNNFIGRIRVLFGFLLACLAGFGYDGLTRWRPLYRTETWRRVFVVAAWALAAGGVLYVLRAARRLGLDRGHLPEVAARMHRPAAVGVLAVALVVVALMRWRSPRVVALALLPVLIVAESLWFVRPFWPRIPRSQFYPKTAAHEFLAEHLGGQRYASQGLTLYTGTNAYYGLRSATGHTFTETTWLRLLNQVDRRVDITPTFTAFPQDITVDQVRSPVLDRMAVRYFALDPTTVPFGRLESVDSVAGNTHVRDGQSWTVSMPAQPVRGLGLAVLPGMPASPDGFARFEVSVTDAGGKVLATGTRRLVGAILEPQDLVAPVAGEDLGAASGPLTVRFTLRSHGGAPLNLATTASGQPQLVVDHSVDDGLRLVFTDGCSIFERTTALPRIRWAARTRVVTSEQTRLLALKQPVPADTVLLDAAGRATDGRPADVRVREDSGDVVKAHVSAKGAGYLVLADGIQNDWSVTVDGKHATLVHADEAMGAVRVPAGEHDVVFSYAASGRAAGIPISALALLVTLGLLRMDRRPQHEEV